MNANDKVDGDDEAEASTLDHSFDNYVLPEKTVFSKPNVEVCLSWKNVKIEANMPSEKKGCRKAVDQGPKKKLILNNLSGCVLPGQFVSILGASGAGKTTLMNHLSGRLQSKNLEVSGEIRVNGVDRSQVPNFGVFSAYIQQDDVLYQTMTVKECIEFAAKLRFLGTPEERDKRIADIIRDLKLTKCQDTKIGGIFIKGISGGERKRTSIGVELITDPSLIFLDEPTTGLDSFTSTQIMMLLKNLAESGRTIIQTIHQPNSDIFEMFDQLMLMAHG